jgi:hypothetical protein
MSSHVHLFIKIFLSLILLLECVSALTSCGVVNVTQCPQDGWLEVVARLDAPPIETNTDPTKTTSSTQLTLKVVGNAQYWEIYGYNYNPCERTEAIFLVNHKRRLTTHT